MLCFLVHWHGRVDLFRVRMDSSLHIKSRKSFPSYKHREMKKIEKKSGTKNSRNLQDQLKK